MHLLLQKQNLEVEIRNGNDLPGVPAFVDSLQINYSPLENLSTYFNFYYQSKLKND